MPISIAIDGPVGAGKSTVSDEVAKRLHILHLDTGAMYRAVGLAATRAGVSLDDEESVSRVCESADIAAVYQAGKQLTKLNGEDVSCLIRTQEAGQAASAVSRYPRVRRKMVALQQELARGSSMLLDGRDIGTVVLKDATVKIFLTASVKARAERRMKQLRAKGDQTPFEDILAEVLARDAQDENRAADPLRKAEDAILIDASELDFEQTVEEVLRVIKEKADV